MDKTELNHPADYVGPMIKWDDGIISHEAHLMPATLRADYIWLKAFTRDQCNRDVDILTMRFREMGIVRDKTTWSKILRGRWQRNSRGEEMPSPVVAADKLAEEIEALRSNVRIETMRGQVPFVETSTWLGVSDLIDARRTPNRVNKFGIIVGHTGSQKTACFREYRLRNNHGATVLVEAPELGMHGEFLRVLARGYGLSPNNSSTQLRDQLMRVLGSGTAADRAQRCIIVDNAQELWIGGRDHDQPTFTFLRRLQDTTGCTIILSITPVFERRLVTGMIEGWFEQIEGRSGGRTRWLRLPEHSPDEDVLKISEAFGLQEARKHLRDLVAISREAGRIRRLFEDLQEGKLLSGRGPFTMQHIREARGED